MVRVHGTAEGETSMAEIVQSSGHSLLDEAALQFARKARFEPSQCDGISHESDEILPIRYRLHSGMLD
jgi:TonB family protein